MHLCGLFPKMLKSLLTEEQGESHQERNDIWDRFILRRLKHVWLN
ncbi:Hypothetical protein DPCES_0014 [Desulfitobacterium hafniense]|uniref:Uncharacterized protein n=1 Tax=Desulfitobacterium hafniense TaxID=49338 RepID=A0A098AWA4_DESHA|nr:Hypothetical protein DPCES_0014 [Desulfitobacterium hafniense]